MSYIFALIILQSDRCVVTATDKVLILNTNDTERGDRHSQRKHSYQYTRVRRLLERSYIWWLVGWPRMRERANAENQREKTEWWRWEMKLVDDRRNEEGKKCGKWFVKHTYKKEREPFSDFSLSINYNLTFWFSCKMFTTVYHKLIWTLEKITIRGTMKWW